MTHLTPERFRRVLGHLPTGVTVITAHGAYGPTGMSVNSVTSLSLEPPLLLVCPARSSSTWPGIRASGRFCVNVMATDQERLCRRFATKGIDRFAGVSWHDRLPGPGLDDAVAWIDCELVEEHDGGDHTIAVGLVVTSEVADHATPLVFFRGGYGTFSPVPSAGEVPLRDGAGGAVEARSTNVGARRSAATGRASGR